MDYSSCIPPVLAQAWWLLEFSFPSSAGGKAGRHILTASEGKAAPAAAVALI